MWRRFEEFNKSRDYVYDSSQYGPWIVVRVYIVESS